MPDALEVIDPGILHDDRLWDANDVARYLKASRSWVLPAGRGRETPVRASVRPAPVRPGEDQGSRARGSAVIQAGRGNPCQRQALDFDSRRGERNVASVFERYGKW